MFTRCPNCGTVFNISDEQLTVADGSVRCGACEIVFDARLSLFTQIDYSLEKNSEVDATAEADIILPNAVAVTSDEQVQEEEEVTETSNEQAPVPIPETINEPVSFLENKKDLSSHLNLIMLIGLLLLISLLLLQITAKHSPYALPTSVQTSLCKFLKCATPSALDKIHILNRDIFTHPEAERALTVTLTMINQAEFAQPYPILELRLFDVVGDVIVARRFRPSEYLSTPWSPSELFPRSKAVSLQLELVDPGQQVVGYEFSFL